MISFENVVHEYNGEKALSGVDLKVKEGGFVLVLGPNGSGKTTLLWHLNALLTPDDGRVVGAIDVETVTLEDIDAEFAKIEAEGAEPEVLDGLSSPSIPKLAVNCDPERGGENPRGAVVARLEAIGYETVVVSDDGRTVFATAE